MTAPDFLDGLADRSADQVRTMRDECRAEESRLSYTRRLLQGRLDIARAEARRRAGDGDADLIGSLSRILADDPSSSKSAPRATAVYAPEAEGGRRHEDTIVDDATLGRLPDLSDEELEDVVARLTADERQVSDQRKTVLDNLDALQAELVRRYREGGMNDLLSGAVADGPPGDS